MSSDPFTDGALRPTTSNATSLPSSHLRHQASQTSLRSGAGSAASNRQRQTRDLFAPPISRRAPSRALRRIEDDVLADSDSEREHITAPTHTRLRRVRRMSPDPRSKSKQKQEEDVDIVHRQPDGNFIREISGEAEALKSHLMAEELVDEERIRAMDDEYVAIARQYFMTGASLPNSRGRKHEEDYEYLRVPMLSHLRAQVMQKLDDERWRFEPTAS